MSNTTETIVLSAIKQFHDKNIYPTAKDVHDYILRHHGLNIDVHTIGMHTRNNYYEKTHKNFGNIIVPAGTEGGTINVKAKYRDSSTHKKKQKITRGISVIYSDEVLKHLYVTTFKRYRKLTDSMSSHINTTSLSHDTIEMMERNGISIETVNIPDATPTKNIDGINVRIKETAHGKYNTPSQLTILVSGRTEEEVQTMLKHIEKKLYEWNITKDKKTCNTLYLYE